MDKAEKTKVSKFKYVRGTPTNPRSQQWPFKNNRPSSDCNDRCIPNKCPRLFFSRLPPSLDRQRAIAPASRAPAARRQVATPDGESSNCWRCGSPERARSVLLCKPGCPYSAIRG